jgi:hypothetical protein
MEDLAHVLQIRRHGFNTGDYTEDDAPFHAGEEKEHGSQLQTEGAAMKCVYDDRQCQREETQHGNRLQDIQKRYQQVAHPLFCGSQDTNPEAKSQADDISDAQTEKGAQGIIGQEAGLGKGRSLQEYYPQ